MASTFKDVFAIPTTELLGGGQTQPAQQVSARAIPSGITFSLVIATADYTPQRIPLILGPVSEAVNNANDVPGVADLNLYQDVNNQGQFVNRLDVTVESSSGRSSAIIHPAYGSLFGDGFAAAVAKERDNLDAVEAL